MSIFPPPPKLKIDLYSDTVTRPTPGMRKAMAEAEVGNEQAGEDPTVNTLCERVAELTGKEAAVYVPSGTMCNEIAYRVFCRQGDEIILDKTGHAIHAETGGPAALSGAMLKMLDGERGIFTGDQVRAAVRSGRRNQPRSRVVSVENTSNLGGGAIWPLAGIKDVTDAAREHKLAAHLDGARLMNAVVATGIPAADYCKPFDSCWIDFSKGLGAPVGAVLAGSKDFIEEAWRWKLQFGGAMRQAGIIAAACVYALDHHVERLADDHETAQILARGLAQIPGIKLVADPFETNLVFFDTSGTKIKARDFHQRLLAKGVRIGISSEWKMRAVTHLDVDRKGAETALAAVRAAAKGER